MKQCYIEKNRYVDSVTLMNIAERALRLPGMTQAETVMGTPANLEMLAQAGFTPANDIGKNDLVIALASDDAAAMEKAHAAVIDMLTHGARDDSGPVYHSLDEIDLHEDGYDLVQISLPGEYAAAEARKAIDMGLDVFIFSDNVSLEDERALKEQGKAKGVLVMGPDCGVGLMGGVALAAGSIVRPGPIGIVGASGSGAQEVACLIEKCGLGVSAIIGTGGRDLYPDIGGITMRMGIARLAADPDTKVIVLVSKLADTGVMDSVLTEADTLDKPVVAVFLGANDALYARHKAVGAHSLEDAALEAVRCVTGTRPVFGFTDADIAAITAREQARYRPEQRYFRGLYCGGTFTEEAMLYLSANHPNVRLTSNLNTRFAARLADSHISEGNAILDLGAEDFTREAPHPVFDPALRLRRLQQELQDPTVAVVLIDFITGPGVHFDPVSAVAAACKAAVAQGGAPTFIATICGAEGDPQNIAQAKALLEDAGVIVAASNYQSARLAGAIMAALEAKA